MKGIDIFCASQASTSIRLSTTNLSMDSPPNNNILEEASSSSTAGGGPRLSSGSIGGRTIDRHNPIIQDEKRLGRPLIPPSPSTSTTTINHHKKTSKKPATKNIDQKRKNVAFSDEENENEDFINIENTTTSTINHFNKNVSSSSSSIVRKHGVLGWGCTRPGDFISPATSSRYLLSDKPSFNALSEFDPLLKLVPAPAKPAPPVPQAEKTLKPHNDEGVAKKKDDVYLPSSAPSSKPPPASSSSSSSPRSSDQVVVLKVSLHCRGCERKMRKHISKMEGVTSFNIDFAAKKLTVVGDVTPLSVLTSVSKVKNAKLLTPTTISSSPVPLQDSNFSEIKKQLGIPVKNQEKGLKKLVDQ